MLRQPRRYCILTKMGLCSIKSIVISGVIAAMLLLANSIAWSAAQEGKSLFEKRCIACHKLPNPGEPPPDGWEQRLEAMAPLACLKDGQKKDILEYLLSHTQQTTQAAALNEDKFLFEEKCSRCHTLDRIFLEPLTAESRRHVVARMQKRSGTSWLSDEDVERILNYLDDNVTEAKSEKLLASDATAEEIFRVRCSACHSLERAYAQLGKGEETQNFAWAHIVSRMRGKAPQWMTEEEAAEIIKYLRTQSEPAG